MRRAVLARAGKVRSEDPEEELTRIEGALRRIDDGSYGICDACGAAIGAQVLLGNPASTECSACAARKAGKEQPTPSGGRPTGRT